MSRGKSSSFAQAVVRLLAQPLVHIMNSRSCVTGMAFRAYASGKLSSLVHLQTAEVSAGFTGSSILLLASSCDSQRLTIEPMCN